jgi:hypothetical protein
MRLLLQFLAGKKTYLVSAGGLIYAVGIGRNWWQHAVEIDLAFGSSVAITIRSAIARMLAQITQDTGIIVPQVPAQAVKAGETVIAVLPITNPGSPRDGGATTPIPW